MKSCLILGSGRSGTSLVAGMLASAGFFMGDRLIKANEANPKGFFEDVEINRINEALIATAIPRRAPLLGRFLHGDRPTDRQRWLARVPLPAHVSCSRELSQRVQSLVSRRPFCFKDPRFCYTLPAWRRFAPDAALLCVFRQPAVTAASILKECERAHYLKSLKISAPIALEIWTLMYRHVLRERSQGDWLFLHYQQAMTQEGMNRIEHFLEAKLDRSFPEGSLSRLHSEHGVPPETQSIYEELCALAEFDPRGGRPAELST